MNCCHGVRGSSTGSPIFLHSYLPVALNTLLIYSRPSLVPCPCYKNLNHMSVCLQALLKNAEKRNAIVQATPLTWKKPDLDVPGSVPPNAFSTFTGLFSLGIEFAAAHRLSMLTWNSRCISAWQHVTIEIGNTRAHGVCDARESNLWHVPG